MHLPGALPPKHSQITKSKENITRGNVYGTQTSKKSRDGGDIENCNFKLVSQNVKGLKTNKVKRETIFNYLKENGDIALLQETLSTQETEELWKNECGCESFFSHGTNNSRGVMIFFSNKLEIEVTEKITDTEGRFLLLKCTIQGTKILIYNVYAPNNEKDHVAFLLLIKEKLEFFDTTEYEYIIGAGDWNFTFEKKRPLRGQLQL